MTLLGRRLAIQHFFKGLFLTVRPLPDFPFHQFVDEFWVPLNSSATLSKAMKKVRKVVEWKSSKFELVHIYARLQYYFSFVLQKSVGSCRNCSKSVFERF